MTHYLKRPGFIGTLFMLAAIIGLLGCALVKDKELRAAQIDPITGETNEPPVVGKEIPPQTTAMVRGVGSSFGPIGEAVAECGLAVIALLIAGYNHRKLSKHLAASPGAISARVTRPRAPAHQPASS